MKQDTDTVKYLNKEEAEITSLIWYAGNPYDPCGYYATIDFQGTSHMVFLAHDDSYTDGPNLLEENADG